MDIGPEQNMSRPSNMPYMKSEYDDFDLMSNGYTSLSNAPAYNNFSHGGSNSIDPSELSVGSGNFNQYNFGGSNMSASYNMGGAAAFGEDELLDSLSNPHDFNNMQSSSAQGMNMNQSHMHTIYSSTPDGAPIQSPFVSGFDYSQFRPLNSIPHHMSPHQGAAYMNKRPSMQASHRKSSAEHRNPMTPRTASKAGLHIGTPDSNALQSNGRAIRAPNSGSRHQKTMSGQFDSTPGSVHSFLDSPLASPSNLAHHIG